MKSLMIVLLMFVVSWSQEGTRYADSRLLFREAMSAGSNLVLYMERNDLEVVKIDMDLISTGNDKQTLKKLSPNFSYIISAVGQPSRILDLDIEVYFVQENGGLSLVAQDHEVDNTPTVTFKPYVSGNYMVNIKAAKMVPGQEGNMGFYFLVIAHN